MIINYSLLHRKESATILRSVIGKRGATNCDGTRNVINMSVNWQEKQNRTARIAIPSRQLDVLILLESCCGSLNIHAAFWITTSRGVEESRRKRVRNFSRAKRHVEQSITERSYHRGTKDLGKFPRTNFTLVTVTERDQRCQNENKRKFVNICAKTRTVDNTYLTA